MWGEVVNDSLTVLKLVCDWFVTIKMIKKWAGGKGGNAGIAYFGTKDQAIKAIETLNRSKQYVAKQYKMDNENEHKEQK